MLLRCLLILAGPASALLAPYPKDVDHRSSFMLFGSNSPETDVSAAASSEKEQQTAAFSKGTIVEFEEKKREHVGVISDVTHKANGGVRYEVEERGHKYRIAEKEVHFAVPPPKNDKQAEQLLAQLEEAHAAHEAELARELDISPELLSMAWEETHEDESTDSLKPSELVKMIHSKKAAPAEKYKAWRLLRSDLGHVFFKDVKEHGRVVAFKAKPPSSVEASKESFCKSHPDDELCQIDAVDNVLRP